MAIELSSLTFTNRADIVPASGNEQILNTGIANTLAGEDIITGTGSDPGITNYGTINTDKGNDTITGNGGLGSFGFGIFNQGPINTGDGNDIITGTGRLGIYNTDIGSIDTGKGNDTITGNGDNTGIFNPHSGRIIDTGDGNDIITGTGEFGITNIGIIDTGNGNDIITGIANKIIVGFSLPGIYQDPNGIINTGDGNDVITGTGTGNNLGILNYGTIDTGAGNDSIIANEGFSGTGTISLGNDKDYLKGFGSGNFNGGNGKDTLELTSGSYTVGISGTTVNFTNGSTIMITSEFEKLIAGSKTYDFNSLTDGQTIIVA